MITITMITNDGDGTPTEQVINEDTTLGQFLEVHFNGNPDDFVMRIRSHGESVQAHKEYVLKDGDRISFSPSKVAGAATRGPGNNAEQIKSLEEKVGDDGVGHAKDIIGSYSVDEIALAYKMTRTSTARKLPKAVENLLLGFPEDRASKMREELLAAV